MDETEKMPRVKGLGRVGDVARERLRAERQRQGLSATALSKRVTAHGRTMNALAIRRIEEGARRVDVDDLVALALALDLAPISFLAPAGEDGGEDFITADDQPPRPLEHLWPWLRGEHSLDPFGGDEADFQRRALPRWLTLEEARHRREKAELRTQVRTLQNTITALMSPGTTTDR